MNYNNIVNSFLVIIYIRGLNAIQTGWKQECHQLDNNCRYWYSFVCLERLRLIIKKSVTDKYPLFFLSFLSFFTPFSLSSFSPSLLSFFPRILFNNITWSEEVLGSFYLVYTRQYYFWEVIVTFRRFVTALMLLSFLSPILYLFSF